MKMKSPKRMFTISAPPVEYQPRRSFHVSGSGRNGRKTNAEITVLSTCDAQRGLGVGYLVDQSVAHGDGYGRGVDRFEPCTPTAAGRPPHLEEAHLDHQP